MITNERVLSLIACDRAGLIDLLDLFGDYTFGYKPGIDSDMQDLFDSTTYEASAINAVDLSDKVTALQEQIRQLNTRISALLGVIRNISEVIEEHEAWITPANA